MGTFCEVYVNSMLQKTNRTNGIGFEADITDALSFDGSQNAVAVHCDCHDYEAWYYEGGGITRNVWLVKTDRLHVDLWGTFVRAERLSDTDWKIRIDTEVRNDRTDAGSCCVRSRILDEDGTEQACLTSEESSIPVREVRTFYQETVLEDPLLWCPETPHLYRLVTEILEGTEVRDCYETVFGVRELVYDAGRVHGIGWPVHWLYTTREAIAALADKTKREWSYHTY